MITLSTRVPMAALIARISSRTASVWPSFSQPTLITMSISSAPSATACVASKTLAAGAMAPSGKPTTAQTLTAEPASSVCAVGTQAELTHTEKNWCARASAHSWRMSASTALALSTV